jgi:hypothetical protein
MWAYVASRLPQAGHWGTRVARGTSVNVKRMPQRTQDNQRILEVSVANLLLPTVQSDDRTNILTGFWVP